MNIKIKCWGIELNPDHIIRLEALDSPNGPRENRMQIRYPDPIPDFELNSRGLGAPRGLRV